MFPGTVKSEAATPQCSDSDAVSSLEEDPVVEQLPVFCNRSLPESVWVLQHPVRPGTRAFSYSHPSASAQVRANQKQLRLQLPLDTTGPSYDPSRGQQMALNADGGSGAGGDNQRFQSGYMDRQELVGRAVDVDPRRLCLGSLQSDGSGGLELHLAPVAAVLTMRPAFDHLEPPAPPSQAPAESEEMERVTVRLSRPAGASIKPDPLGAKRRQSEEPWVSAQVFSAGHARSRSQRALLSASSEAAGSVVPLSSTQYRQHLLPQASVVPGESTGGLASLPLREVGQLPLCEQLEALLSRQQLCSLHMLMSQLKGAGNCDAVVRQLQQVARLVRGLWAVRSELLFPSDDPRLPARDLLLYWFTQRQVVTRQQLLTATSRLPLSREHALQLLSGVAVPSSDGWSLKLPADPATETSYPELVQRQQLLWTARHSQLARQLQLVEQQEEKELKPDRCSSLDSQSPTQVKHQSPQQLQVRPRRNSSRRHSDSLDSKLHTLAQSQPVT